MSNHDLLSHFSAYSNSGLFNVNYYVSAHFGDYLNVAPDDKAEIFKVLLYLGRAAYPLDYVILTHIR